MVTQKMEEILSELVGEMEEALDTLEKNLEKSTPVVKFKRIEGCDLELPTPATERSAGMDLRYFFNPQDNTRFDVGSFVNIDALNAKKSTKIEPGKTAMLSCGFNIELPPGTVGMVCSRSGLAAKNGILVLNSPGIIDEDYRGELKIILHNTSNQHFTVTHGDRIAQLVVMSINPVKTEQAEALSSTDRGTGGFGSTGVK